MKLLPTWKQENPKLKDVYAQTLQEVCIRVDLAFQHFFRRCKNGEKPGYPRFKTKEHYKSFTYPQSGFKLTGNKHLHLPKIGDIKIKLHRPLQSKVKRLTVKRDWLGNWYACFIIKFESVPLPTSEKVAGIDLGCKKFATLSTGEEIANPRFFRKDEKALAKAQRNNKPKRVLQHIHQRIANRRTDFAHKLSRNLVNVFQVIIFEKLDIKEMQSKNWHSLNKSIGDAAWGQLISMTAYKAEETGRTFITVDPKNTSQLCSGCGQIVPKDLSVRVHSCPHCGLVLDRDLNAARNILARGLASLPKG